MQPAIYLNLSVCFFKNFSKKQFWGFYWIKTAFTMPSWPGRLETFAFKVSESFLTSIKAPFVMMFLLAYSLLAWFSTTVIIGSFWVFLAFGSRTFANIASFSLSFLVLPTPLCSKASCFCVFILVAAKMPPFHASFLPVRRKVVLLPPVFLRFDLKCHSVIKKTFLKNPLLKKIPGQLH